MSEKCYSINEEEFNYESEEAAVEKIWNNGDHKAGDTATIFAGDTVPRSASDFVPSLADLMVEQAYDQHGEYSDTWEFSRAEEDDLQEVVAKAVDEWADKNNMQPRFWSIENIRQIKIRFINDDGEYETLPETE